MQLRKWTIIIDAQFELAHCRHRATWKEQQQQQPCKYLISQFAWINKFHVVLRFTRTVEHSGVFMVWYDTGPTINQDTKAFFNLRFFIYTQNYLALFLIICV